MKDAIWQAWYSAVPAETIEKFIEVGDKYPLQSATVGESAENSITNNDIRKSDIAWINPIDPEAMQLNQCINWHAQESNRNCWGFNIGSIINDIQYTTYHAENQGFYNWHIDTFFLSNTRAYDRKVSVIIQLSDSDDYEGGDFEIDSKYEPPNREDLRKKGTIIVIPSFIPHRVTPVTKGTRKSIVSWVEGPKWV